MPSGLHRTRGAHPLHFITCSCYRRRPFLNRARSRDRFLSILEQTRRDSDSSSWNMSSCRNTFTCSSLNRRSELRPP
jgi:REP element-mobilizing transposase RayT